MEVIQIIPGGSSTPDYVTGLSDDGQIHLSFDENEALDISELDAEERQDLLDLARAHAAIMFRTDELTGKTFQALVEEVVVK